MVIRRARPCNRFRCRSMTLSAKDEAVTTAAESIYAELRAAGIEVVLDDRDERPGVKFKDADLLGFPIRVNVGGRSLKEGKIEVVLRRDKSVRAVARGEAVAAVVSARAEIAGRSAAVEVAR